MVQHSPPKGGQVGAGEGLLDRRADCVCIFVGLPLQTYDGERAANLTHFRRRKERIIRSKELVFAQILNPINETGQIIGIDGQEVCCEGLRVLCLHVAGILINAAVDHVDVFEPQRCDSAVARACEHEKCKECFVATVCLSGFWHVRKCMARHFH